MSSSDKPTSLLCVFSSKMRTNFDYIGIPVEETPQYVRLRRALVFTYEESLGNIGSLSYTGLQPGYMLLGNLGPNIDDVVVTIPMEAIAYTVSLPYGSEHPVVAEYHDFFTQTEETAKQAAQQATPEHP